MNTFTIMAIPFFAAAIVMLTLGATRKVVPALSWAAFCWPRPW
ncbi:hypothetical protein [Klebsiella grimontii]|nr:hypothetical protein [Klebsiella grimontii]